MRLFLCLFLISILFSCETKTHRLLVETQKSYLNELSDKETMIWEAQERKLYEDYHSDDFIKIITQYREYFDKNVDEEIHAAFNDSINTLRSAIINIGISYLSTYEKSKFEEMFLSESVVKSTDSVETLRIKIKQYELHNDFLLFILYNTSNIDCRYTPPFSFVLNPQHLTFKKNSKATIELLPLHNNQIGNVDSVFTGPIDSFRFKMYQPYEHCEFEYIPVTDQSVPINNIEQSYRADYGKVHIQLNTEKLGDHTIQGVARILLPLDQVRYFPFFIEYTIVECPI